MHQYENFHIVDHPLIQHKLSLIREKTTGHKIFRELVNEVATLVAFELTRDFPTNSTQIKTPMTSTTGQTIVGQNVVLVPILRAGLGMVEGLIQLIPNARVGYVGMERNEKTHEPVDYYFKIPKEPEHKNFILIDPMLATGGTAIATANSLKKRGATQIKFMCLIAAPEGMSAFCEAHPDIEVYTAALDEKLNENKYIIPGLGDAGDRLFGTL
ncbi:MAG: uracil phosphoribosyltransferase [Candidatus Marinimicrobia bacterium]|jgi:uracil phosphoribosyltransferase|nr:uracil phosphoribosyltransferase [Candidatus Neomarinimicrobiota bacterium]MBT3496993.1 uracil phosphoribosyltransferase [Candidatus Neomarinimicrobiota bacterium]MBT3731508.1 uracil phosphoribosyltransferase [Candidatus Neomarinimicrobiota bacterium]MBT4593267.1 uracil phosphoribosyltransferase [Candidatus Neomarinimicrobiota bacterium]MBT4991598.1 uracil phosphoribosyltransferase [Candidatus Neomarinimicrobiota bacterium]